MTSTAHFAVIGAGAAGLCAAKHLLAQSQKVTVYEIGTRVGGLWVYESDSGLSPTYRSLHLNSEAKVTAYKDFAFPAGSPLYPDHEQVAAYLDAYADTFDLKRHIRFQARVLSATPIAAQAGSRWRVTRSDGASAEYDGVIIATGHQGAPIHPEWTAAFAGEYLHAHSYRVPEPFREKRVLVVGVGNSAVDIAADICTLTRTTVISARSPVLIMPRIFCGVPTSRVLGRLEKPWMPWPIRRTIRNLITRLAHGTMEQWGFVTPKTRVHPTTHPSLIAHMLWQRVTAKPAILGASGNNIRFADGSNADFDTVIGATGYEINLPFLAPEFHPLKNKRLELFLRIVPPNIDGLYFLGMFNVNGGGNIRMMDEQAEWLVPILAGKSALPAKAAMRAFIDQEHALIDRRYPGSKRYALELEPSVYRDMLVRARRITS